MMAVSILLLSGWCRTSLTTGRKSSDKGTLQQVCSSSSPDFAGEGASSAAPHRLHLPLPVLHETQPRVVGHQEVGRIGWNEDQAIDWTGDTGRPRTQALPSLAEWRGERER